jgi:hypothetical protein
MGGEIIRPAGTKTVFPARSPLYLLSACRAVMPASGTEAASSKDNEGGLMAMHFSVQTTNSLNEPTIDLNIDRIFFLVT